MSDNLRDRIAAAIYDGMNEWDRKWAIDPRLTPPGWDGELKSETTCYKIADAVIAELGLHRNDEEDEYGGYKPTGRHRYVTEWTTDD